MMTASMKAAARNTAPTSQATRTTQRAARSLTQTRLSVKTPPKSKTASRNRRSSGSTSVTVAPRRALQRARTQARRRRRRQNLRTPPGGAGVCRRSSVRRSSALHASRACAQAVEDGGDQHLDEIREADFRLPAELRPRFRRISDVSAQLRRASLEGRVDAHVVAAAETDALQLCLDQTV